MCKNIYLHNMNIKSKRILNHVIELIKNKNYKGFDESIFNRRKPLKKILLQY